MVLITGASSGIGRACAGAYAKRGRDLILVARREDRLSQLSRDLESQWGVRVHSFALDVSDRGAVDDWANHSESLLQRVEILVNNAGLARGLEPLQEGHPADWEAMMNTNVLGFLWITHAVLPHLLKAGRGHLVNLGSVAGRWNYPKGNVYAATKAAVRSLSESMRLDLLGTGIRVTEIAPGMVETEFSEVRFGGDQSRAKAVYQGIQALNAEDIAEAVVWSTERPAHVNIQEMVIYPTDQASPTQVHRR